MLITVYCCVVLTLLMGPKAWNKISCRAAMAGGVVWAREICAELCRDEEAEAYEELVWFDCDEWPPEDQDQDEDEAATPPRKAEVLREATPPQRCASVGTELQRLSDFTLGQLELPVGGRVTARAEAVCVDATREPVWVFEGCWLCGKVGCRCVSSGQRKKVRRVRWQQQAQHSEISEQWSAVAREVQCEIRAKREWRRLGDRCVFVQRSG